MITRGGMARRLALAASLGVALVPAVALAHPGRPPEPHDLAGAWTWEPGVVLPLLLGAAAYAWGTRRVWARAGVGRGVRRADVARFAAGWLVLAVALVSPLHTLGSALFSAHMAQHELLLAAAAPLLVLGRPGVAMAWAVPRRWRAAAGHAAHAIARRGGALTAPFGATAAHAAAIWCWHAPPLYTLALRSEAAHAAQHASFLGTALLFWWAVLSPRGRRHPGAGMMALFATTLHTGALGALFALGPRVLIPHYLTTTAAFGLSPLEDQQLAGLVMWVPGSVAYIAAALWLLGTRLRSDGPTADLTRIVAHGAP